MRRLIFSLSYGFGSIAVYLSVMLLIYSIWENPQLILSHLGIEGLSTIELSAAFIMAVLWAYGLYSPNISSLKNNILKGESIGFVGFLSLVLMMGIDAPGVDGVGAYFETIVSFLILGIVMFGWLIAIVSFIVAYLLFKLGVNGGVTNKDR
jgi:hypothetical protein